MLILMSVPVANEEKVPLNVSHVIYLNWLNILICSVTIYWYALRKEIRKQITPWSAQKAPLMATMPGASEIWFTVIEDPTNFGLTILHT